MEIILFSCLFLCAFLLERSRTYFILFWASIMNMGLYPFTNEYSVVLESSLDVTILLALLLLGDKHRLYQVGLLLIALIFHFRFELDQTYGTDLIFSNYGAAITGITIMQLLGVSHGVFNRLSKHSREGGGYRYLPLCRFNRDRGQI